MLGVHWRAVLEPCQAELVERYSVDQRRLAGPPRAQHRLEGQYMRARDLSRARTLQIANRRPQQSSPGAWTSSSCASKAARTTALQGALLHRSHAGTPDRASRRDRGQLRMAPIHCITWGSAAACNCKAPSCDYTGINSVTAARGRGFLRQLLPFVATSSSQRSAWN